MKETSCYTNTIENTPCSNEELLYRLQKTQSLLHETELHLCEMEVEKEKYRRKYLYYRGKTDYWKDQAEQIKEQINVIINSRSWKLRSILLKPINRLKNLRTKSEPDPHVPHQNLIHATLLNDLPNDTSWTQSFLDSPRIAIQVHVFYPELIKDICEKLANMPFKYDLYITTTEKYKATYILNHLSKCNTADNYRIDVIQNKGRDVIPFLRQMQPVLLQYDYICHLHTKRSLHNDIGKLWRQYLYENLMGNSQQIKKILYEFECNPKLGIVFPDTPKLIKEFLNWGENKQFAEELLTKMGINHSNLPDEILFPAGTMFWARTEAVKDMFLLDLSTLNIPDELGQVDGTVMHAIERLWLYLTEANGYSYLMFNNVSNIEVTAD